MSNNNKKDNFEFGVTLFSKNKNHIPLGIINDIFFENDDQKKIYINTNKYNISIESEDYINKGTPDKDLNDYVDHEILCIEIANFVPINPKKLDSALKDDPIFLYAPQNSTYSENEFKYLIVSIHLDNGKKFTLYGKNKGVIKIGNVNV